MSFRHDRTKECRLARRVAVPIIFRMDTTPEHLLDRLLADLVGADRQRTLLAQIDLPAQLRGTARKALMRGPAGEQLAERVPRAVIAQALNMALFEDLLKRVPAAGDRVAEVVSEGGRIFFDHGALRTVVTPFPTALPSGHQAFARILGPLGYRVTNEYPLTRISMTGRSFTHEDHPEQIAQFFVSELHLGGFSTRFQAAAQQVLVTAKDPVTPAIASLLRRLSADRELPYEDALALLRGLLPCFGRQHARPTLEAYRILLEESAEMAWIATEGHTFNHVTERVRDVQAVADRQKQLGRPMKDVVEVSRSGRVRQTAYFAAQVDREFPDAEGRVVTCRVPGSFYEFIQRERIIESDDRSRLDLGFDSGNAQGIFRMTAAA